MKTCSGCDSKEKNMAGRDHPCPCICCINLDFSYGYCVCSIKLNTDGTHHTCYDGNNYKGYRTDWVRAIKYKDYIYKGKPYEM